MVLFTLSNWSDASILAKHFFFTEFNFFALQQNSSDSEKPKKKKKRKEKKKKVYDNDCFRCGDGGELLLCDQTSCTRAYHLKCLKLEKPPTGQHRYHSMRAILLFILVRLTGRWVCPWHHCDVCGRRALKLCSECPNSFCPQHLEGNIFSVPDNRLLCSDHEDLLEVLEASKVQPLPNQENASVPLSSSEVTGDSSPCPSDHSSITPPPVLPAPAAVLPPTSDTDTDSAQVKPRPKARKSPIKRSKPAVANGNDSDSSSEGKLTIVEDAPPVAASKPKRSRKSTPHKKSPVEKKSKKVTSKKQNNNNSVGVKDPNKEGSMFESSDEFPDLVIDIPSI